MTNLDARIESAVAQLKKAATDYAPATFAHSLGLEDMVVFDLIDRHQLAIDVFTLDTGRLFAETYALLDQLQQQNRTTPIAIFFPQTEAVEEYINTCGINGFYRSVELRKSCCYVRKVEPLQRALQGKKSWVTGLRRSQSGARNDLPSEVWDVDHGLMKFNPLADWSLAEVKAYLDNYNVPYNVLHDQNFPSVGCAPCTRAIAAGEDLRAGRWWWEQQGTQECGLHKA